MFAQWWGDVQAKSAIFVQRFVRGTGRGFESPPLRKHNRYAQCRGTELVLRTLAHLHAAQTHRDTKASKRANFNTTPDVIERNTFMKRFKSLILQLTFVLY